MILFVTFFPIQTEFSTSSAQKTCQADSYFCADGPDKRLIVISTTTQGHGSPSIAVVTYNKSVINGATIISDTKQLRLLPLIIDVSLSIFLSIIISLILLTVIKRIKARSSEYVK